MIGASATQIQRQLGAGERQLLGIPMASRCFGAEAFVNKYIFLAESYLEDAEYVGFLCIF